MKICQLLLFLISLTKLILGILKNKLICFNFYIIFRFNKFFVFIFRRFQKIPKKFAGSKTTEFAAGEILVNIYFKNWNKYLFILYWPFIKCCFLQEIIKKRKILQKFCGFFCFYSAVILF